MTTRVRRLGTDPAAGHAQRDHPVPVDSGVILARAGAAVTVGWWPAGCNRRREPLTAFGLLLRRSDKSDVDAVDLGIAGHHAGIIDARRERRAGSRVLDKVGVSDGDGLALGTVQVGDEALDVVNIYYDETGYRPRIGNTAGPGGEPVHIEVGDSPSAPEL